MEESKKLWIIAEVTCDCGNKFNLEGFYPSSRDGLRTPASDFICCDRCGKVRDRRTGAIVGRRSFDAPGSDPEAA